MQTNFSPAQLEDAAAREADRVLRACVHCGFCLATCPTYVLLGNELDSPRGRIYLIKNMLEDDRPASATVATHVDRCLSCLGCMTTCPSGVQYQRLVDIARARIHRTMTRPWPERLLQDLLAFTLPRPLVFRFALAAARALRPFARHLPDRLGGALRLVPDSRPPLSPFGPRPLGRARSFPAEGRRRLRVALLPGCVQQVLAPEINAATIRLLTRHGVEVVVADGTGCCGALVHHLGREDQARASARANVAAWSGLIEGGGLDAIIANAAGCGVMVKDYGFLLRGDPAWADRAAQVSQRTRDVAEILHEVGLDHARAPREMVVAYQSACGLQHGQRIHDLPRDQLAAAGFDTRDVPEGHLCCGSAGIYNIMQPALAQQLGARKAANIARVEPDVVAAGNIGCIVQIRGVAAMPVVHPVELLDWATGGPVPPALGPGPKGGPAAA